LCKEVERTVDALAMAGIGRGSRVALALPNEPEAATLTLSVLCGAICVPVNPVYGTTMCESLLRSLRVDALIAPAKVDPPAMAVARALGFDLLRAAPVPQGAAGTLALHVERARPRVTASSPHPDDVAIVFHTSGTTSKPKIVH
jgi:acyl-CoA synthetase (AMP-forming)/AMP-acid ligase II